MVGDNLCSWYDNSGSWNCGLEGTIVRVIEPDDGSGWVKVENEAGNSGLVPASYLGPAPVGHESAGSGKERQGVGKSGRPLDLCR
jgi:hypothetical protein